MKALIIDDEAPARGILRHLLKDFDGIEIIGEAENGFEAIKLIREKKPELLFLDIKMPKISGFELLELLDDMPKVIFTTAFDQYAIDAFEKGAVDYLLKPINKERLKKAILRIEKYFDQTKIENLTEQKRISGAPIRQIVVKNGSKIEVIDCEAIEYIKAEDDYVSIKANDRKFLKKMVLGKLEKSLDRQNFVRVHRSYIANITFLEKIEKWTRDQYLGITKTGDKIKISKLGYKILKERLNI
jgi:two-component system, LytTR family, response regulator